jgi:hypothetical protein
MPAMKGGCHSKYSTSELLYAPTMKKASHFCPPKLILHWLAGNAILANGSLPYDICEDLKVI